MPFHPLLLFFDVSGGELLVIILVVFLVFGPQKMPEIARKIGKAMNEMKKASNDLTREFRQEAAGIRSEIKEAQENVREEVDTLNREVNVTRARVRNDLNLNLEEPVTPANEENTVQPVPEKPGESEIAG